MKIYTNCRRCNRPLKSKESRRRGYGSYCYSKLSEKNNNNIKIDKEEQVEIEGQIDLLEEVM